MSVLRSHAMGSLNTYSKESTTVYPSSYRQFMALVPRWPHNIDRQAVLARVVPWIIELTITPVTIFRCIPRASPRCIQRNRILETEISYRWLGKRHTQEEVLVEGLRMCTVVCAILDRHRWCLHAGLESMRNSQKAECGGKAEAQHGLLQSLSGCGESQNHALGTCIFIMHAMM